MLFGSGFKLTLFLVMMALLALLVYASFLVPLSGSCSVGNPFLFNPKATPLHDELLPIPYLFLFE